MSINLRRFNLETKEGRVFNALVLNGETLTAAEISHRFDIANPTATISDIRQRGYAIYGNTVRARNGVVVTKYRHGEASRKMVALAYRAMSLGLAD